MDEMEFILYFITLLVIESVVVIEESERPLTTANHPLTTRSKGFGLVIY